MCLIDMFVFLYINIKQFVRHEQGFLGKYSCIKGFITLSCRNNFCYTFRLRKAKFYPPSTGCFLPIYSFILQQEIPSFLSIQIYSGIAALHHILFSGHPDDLPAFPYQ